MGNTPAVFLDRDGIINRAIIRNGKPYPPNNLNEFTIIPETVTAILNIAKAGYTIIGITNQPDVARGTQSREIVEMFNSLILSTMPVKEIFVCYHDDADECECRKPKPGLILQAVKKYNLDLSQSWMIGDRWKDITAGHAAGLKTIFINYHYMDAYLGGPADFTAGDTASIEKIILEGLYENPR
jgi:D-glycero-D-manno-heptose 1,7-bisphosphate phosphatase